MAFAFNNRVISFWGQLTFIHYSTQVQHIECEPNALAASIFASHKPNQLHRHPSLVLRVYSTLVVPHPRPQEQLQWSRR